jgi:predicted Zn-dependent protease
MERRTLNTFARAIASVAVLACAACQTVHTTRSGAIGVERTQTMSSFVSEKEVEQNAAKQYRQVLADASKGRKLDRDAAEVARVQAISKRLIAQAPVFRPDAASWPWQVHVIDDRQMNAWCMPGGKIVVYSGLIDRLKLSDDELAAVIGHEIAHALREHSREKISQQMPVSVLAEVAAAAGYGTYAQLGTTGFQLLVGLPNSRGMETEADRIGVELAARAGYDPRAAITLWQKMGAATGSGQIEWLSTHPSDAARQKDLRDYAERVTPLYRQAHP